MPIRFLLIVAAVLLFSSPLLAEPTPFVSWNAANPGASPTTGWEPAINNSTGTTANLTWVNSGGTLNNSPTTNLAGITATYQFGAGQSMRTAQAVWNPRIPEAIQNEDATFEIWFRPDSFPVGGPVQYLHEAGGGGTGIGIYLDGTNLGWTIDGGTAPANFSQTVDLNSVAGLDTSELIQAVLVFDRSVAGGTSNDDSFEIYINGQSATGPVFAPVPIETWSGTGGAGLADFDGSIPEGAPVGGTDFVGEIAIFSHYREALGADDVLLTFQAIVPPPPPLSPEPSSLILMTAMSGIAGLVYWRRKKKLAA